MPQDTAELPPLSMQVKQVGEALLTVGGPNSWAAAEKLSAQQLGAVLQAVRGRLGAMDAEMTVLRQRTLPGASKAEPGEQPLTFNPCAIFSASLQSAGRLMC